MSSDETRTLSPSDVPSSALSPLRIAVVDGLDHGRHASLTSGTLVVGTQSDCGLVLTDPTVSRRHVSLELLPGGVRVTDLKSKNGVKYLGARTGTVEVPIGAVLQVGETHLGLYPADLPESAVSAESRLGGLHGRSLPMRRLFAEITQVAAGDTPVVILGETGTGKEEVARAIHALSPRAAGPFRSFNCGSTGAEQVQSALFGHAPEGAGALEEANGGTLFLDEVAELPLDLQPALLHALDTRSFNRIGDSESRSSDFRLLVATQVDLEEAAAQGKFRKDLYFRLAGFKLKVPPLRERRDDIPLLAGIFAQGAQAGTDKRVPDSMVAALCAYHWPGNVRELRNVVERVLALGPEAVLQAFSPTPTGEMDFHQARELAVNAFEKSYLEALIARNKSSRADAARQAGLARSYFYELLGKHGLSRKPPDKG